MKKRLYFMVALLMVAGMLLAGCQSASPAATSAAATSAAVATTAPEATASATATTAAAATATALPQVALNWYFPGFGGTFTDLAKVNDALNQAILPKLNATVKLNEVAYADYETKMNVMTASGGDMDIVWTSGWCFNYAQNVQKGAFAALDDLLALTPDLKASMPDTIWNASKVQGKIYAVPNDQIMATRKGVVIQKRWIDKYNIDVSTIKSLKDVEPLLEKLKANEPDVIPYGVYDNTFMLATNLYALDDQYCYYANDPGCKLYSQYFTPEYKDYAELMHSWFTKGYIASDTALAKLADVRKTGKIAVLADLTLKPGGEASEKQANGGFDVVYVPFNTPVLVAPTGTMDAILQSSANKERAILFLQLVNTDSGVFNLIANGIEGTHYTKIDSQFIKPVDKSGYAPNQDWAFGNQFLAYLHEGMAADVWEQTKKVNDSAIVTLLNGFSFDDTNVKSELANINTVYSQYEVVVGDGAVDTNKVLPEFQSKLKAAGMDAVLAEYQKQIDAFLAAKK